MTDMYWLVAALVIAGCLAVFISSRLMLTRTCAGLRLELQRQIDSLSAKITALEETASARTAALAPGKIEASAAPGASDEITPETLAAIVETITALLGRKVHIRSVKILETPNAIANPWAQHGRAVVQASHDLAQPKRER
jgi:hypothetical protein